jgi:hypothetical protein
MLPKIDYLILDIDKLNSQSDRELALEFFRNSPWEVILGESRSPFNLKGVLRVERMPWRQGKEVLKEIQIKINKMVTCKVDLSASSRATYQAPINTHNVLLHKSGIKYPIPSKVDNPIPRTTKVPDKIQQMCIDALVAKGFSFNKPTKDGYQCSHFSEIKTPNGFSWIRTRPYDIIHWNPDRSVSVWDEIRITPEYKAHQKKQSEKLVNEIMPERPTSGVKERYLKNYPEDVEDFLLHKKMLKITSPMGTAKSNVIEEVIHQARKNELRVLFIANRISLAEDICRKYDGLKYYLGTELEGNKYTQGDDLVVQIDSLHKFKVKFFDVVIIDEAATTLMHLLTLDNHLVQTSKQIFSLKEKKIVLADAFLFNEMTDIFATKEETVCIDNLYKDKVHLEFYEQKDNFILDLIQEAKNHPVTFSSGSTKVLDVVGMMAKEHHLKTVTISGETPKNEKSLIYNQMQNETPDYDILMFSPTLTVGVSNVNQIETHYHYDTGSSMNVLSSIQMVKRTRTAKTIKFFLQEKVQFSPVVIEKIQNQLTEFHDTDDYGDSVGVSKTGIEFSRLQRLFNIMENRHKVSFLKLLDIQFEMSPDLVTHNTSKIPPFFSKLSKIVDQKKKNDNLKLFEQYRQMTPEELQDGEYQLFGTSKAELIQSFQDIKSDETLDLTEEELDNLIKEEIKIPGTVQFFKNLKLDGNKHPELKKRFLSINTKKDLEQNNISIADYGFKRVRNLYIQNELIYSLLGSDLYK